MKNWLIIAIVSVLSFTVSTAADAASKSRHHTSAHSAKAKAKAHARKSSRHVRAAKHSGKRLARRSVGRVVARSHAAPLVLTPVSIDAPLIAKSAQSLAAASSASGASFGQLYGLHHTHDPLSLKSSVALVMDQDTSEVVFAKNSEAVLPIASLTKLMTAMVMVEAKLDFDEEITITSEDVDTEKNSSSRLAVGVTLSRGELLHLALMASENRAAHALGRTYPGGLEAFVKAMNAKARSLGMADTRYVDPTGLNSNNQSSARDLAALVQAAYQQPLIRELSTSQAYAVRVGRRQLQFHNTNSLVRNPAWDIGLQKTGYIVEAGRCLVMQAKMAGRKFIMIFLDSAGRYSRQADAERVRRWIESVSQRGELTTVARAKVTS